MVITVAAHDTTLERVVREVSELADVPYRALHLQALMHLPRIAGPDGTVGCDHAAPDVRRVASFVPRWAEWGPPVPCSEDAATWQVRELEESCARDIMERFHYLHSHRTDSRHYGLWTATETQRPAAAASVSENDVGPLQMLAAHTGVSAERSRVLSRVFAFPWAPRNAISALLGRLARRERQLGGELLLTYVNPNVGFSGVSYRASNWKVIGDEPIQGYAYLDGRYITNRELDYQFGSHDAAILSTALGGRFSRSTMPLAPLLVFARSL